MPVDNELKILTDLGLTYCQAKIYFALIQCEKATAKGLSDITKIAVHDIYRIVPKLEELGLVEKGLGRPKIYRAVPPDIGVNYLIQENISKTNDAVIQAKLLVQELCEVKKNPNKLFGKTPQFILIPQQIASIKRKVNAFKAAKKEYYVVCSEKRFKKAMFEFFNVPIMALKKGVKIRCIVENIEDNLSFEELNKLKQYPNYQLRQISYNPLIQFSVIDNEQAFIVTEAHSELLETPSLWTNNPCIISLLSDYFEILWKKAQYQNKEHNRNRGTGNGQPERLKPTA